MAVLSKVLGLTEFPGMESKIVGKSRTRVSFAKEFFDPKNPKSWILYYMGGFALNSAQPDMNVRRAETAQGTSKMLDGAFVWHMGAEVENDRVQNFDAFEGEALKAAYEKTPWLQEDRVPLVLPQRVYEGVKAEGAVQDRGSKGEQLIALETATALRVTKVILADGTEWKEGGEDINRVRTLVLDGKFYEEGTLFWKNKAPVYGPKLDFLEVADKDDLLAPLQPLKGKHIDELVVTYNGEAFTVTGGKAPIRCTPGDAKLTSVGELKNVKHGVIHAVAGRPSAFKLKPEKDNEEAARHKKQKQAEQMQFTRACYKKALKEADKKLRELKRQGVAAEALATSIALALLSAGYYAGDIAIDVVIRTALDAITEYFEENPDSLLTQVHIVITKQTEADGLPEELKVSEESASVRSAGGARSLNVVAATRVSPLASWLSSCCWCVSPFSTK